VFIAEVFMLLKKFVQGILFFSIVFWGCKPEESSNEQMVNLIEVKEDTEGQLRSLNEAIKRSKNDGSLYARRAVLYLKNGELKNALEDADAAVRLTKNNPYSLFVKAQILRAQNKPEEALPLALLAERNSYQNSSLYILLGDLNLKIKDYKQAKAYLDKAEQLSPADEFVYYYKGKLAEVSGDTARAVKNYKLALGQAPVFYEAQRELAGLFLYNKDYESARQYLKVLKKEAVKDGLAWYYRGLLYQNEEKLDSAVYALARAVKLNDTLQVAHYKLGLLKYRFGNTDSALEHLQKAERHNRKPRYLSTLAGSLERKGNYIQSLQTYQRLIEVEPGNSYAYLAINRLKSKLEKPLSDTTKVKVRQEQIELLD
jgi:tetratricopeptide (TPR) repeat protein